MFIVSPTESSCTYYTETLIEVGFRLFPTDCPLCKQLFDAASAATTRHIEAVGRLQMANIMQDQRLIPSLAVKVEDARQQREDAMSAYKRHSISHRARSAASGASD